MDGDDFAVFKACSTRSKVPYSGGLPPGCKLARDPAGFIDADLDRDADVDQNDFGIFQAATAEPENL